MSGMTQLLHIHLAQMRKAPCPYITFNMARPLPPTPTLPQGLGCVQQQDTPQQLYQPHRVSPAATGRRPGADGGAVPRAQDQAGHLPAAAHLWAVHHWGRHCILVCFLVKGTASGAGEGASGGTLWKFKGIAHQGYIFRINKFPIHILPCSVPLSFSPAPPSRASLFHSLFGNYLERFCWDYLNPWYFGSWKTMVLAIWVSDWILHFRSRWVLKLEASSADD